MLHIMQRNSARHLKTFSGRIVTAPSLKRPFQSRAYTGIALFNANAPADALLKRGRLLSSSSSRPYFTTTCAHIPKSKSSPSPSIDEKSVWIHALEGTASAPWRDIIPEDDVEKLKRAQSLLLQMFMYMSRPHDDGPEGIAARAGDFEWKVVTADSEMARARRAFATILIRVIMNLGAVPASSPLREKYPAIWALHENLCIAKATHLDTWDDDMFVLGVTENVDGGGNFFLPLGQEKKGGKITTREKEQNVLWEKFWDEAHHPALVLFFGLEVEGFQVASQKEGRRHGSELYLHYKRFYEENFIGPNLVENVFNLRTRE